VRVGVLTTSYPRHAGDSAGNFVAGFTRWLSQRADVEVLCADEKRPLFYRGGAPLSLPRRWPEAVGFSAKLLAVAARRARAWDAVVSHWLVPSSAIAMLVGRRKPHLAIAHGSDVRLLAKLPGGKRLMRDLSARADLVYVAEHLKIEGAPGRVVAMGVDVTGLRGGDREGTRRLMRLDRYTLLFLGRLIHDKGVDRAIDELPEGSELLIAGEGPERNSLEARARGKRVRFLGEVRGDEKRNLLAAADALVFCSRIDGAPTVIQEARAVGLPVISDLRQRPARENPVTDCDWSVVGPRLAANLSLGITSGTVQVTRV
jgi:glycosyltransferase involved in cell wall biosynthesis